MEKSQHASARRASELEVLKHHKIVSEHQLITRVMESLPYVAAILNQERQYVFVNKVLIDLLSVDQQEALLGKRFGESVNCIHAKNNSGGCGTTKSCRYCGAVNSILDSQKNQEKTSKECRITASNDSGTVSFDFSVTSSPIEVGDSWYTLIVVKDISDEKRRQILERIFFHDVLNKAGSMDGLLDLLQEIEDQEEIKSTLAVIQTVSTDLVAEIQSQRDLLAAESGDYQIQFKVFDPRVLMAEVAEQMRHHKVTEGKKIETIIASEQESIKSDQTLLSRVLTNMFKNAIEASSVGETITGMVYDLEDAVGFCIQNPSVMPEDIKTQIFQRSFSTKGTNRGLGTYSIKLLGEKYLKGRVYFSSEVGDGTQFFIEVPVDPQDQ